MNQAADSNSGTYNVPAHMPDRLVFDVDFYNSPQPMEDFQIAWSNVRNAAPSAIFWTPRNGAHWDFMRGADIASVQSGIQTLPQRSRPDSGQHRPAIPVGTTRDGSSGL